MQQIAQDHGLEKALDNTLLLAIVPAPALEREGKRLWPTIDIKNVNRVVGTIVGSEVSRRYGAEGLPEDTIKNPP